MGWLGFEKNLFLLKKKKARQHNNMKVIQILLLIVKKRKLSGASQIRNHRVTLQSSSPCYFLCGRTKIDLILIPLIYPKQTSELCPHCSNCFTENGTSQECPSRLYCGQVDHVWPSRVRTQSELLLLNQPDLMPHSILTLE